MKLNAWTWLISGTMVSLISGYVYLTIPKNGQPNMAMALFFFIGIIFMIIGIVQLFFKRADDQSIINSLNNVEQPEPKIVTMPNLQNLESKPNKIDETIAQMMQQEQQLTTQTKSQIPVSTTTSQNAPKTHHTGHTNSFSKMYEYKGPVHNASTGVHAEHPVTKHTQTTTGISHQTNASTSQHRIQNTTEHSIKCRKCGNANTGSSNYCHQCGSRLK